MNTSNIRRIEIGDYHRKHLELYKNLSIIDPDKISENEYINFVNKLDDNHMIFVICDSDCIIGSVTIIIEHKLIHNLGKVGHIEDVVVSQNHQGYGIGKSLIQFASNYCKMQNCYKIILNCNNDKVNFYKKCGFTEKGIEMAYYL